MKRPWLLTQNGKKTAMHAANFLSLLLFMAFVLQFTLVERPRTQVPQLDTANVTYCEITECSEVFGVRLENGAAAKSNAIQTPIGVELELNFSNTARYEGKRQLWIRMETSTGEFVEAASTWVEFGLKIQAVANFSITGTLDEFQNSRLYLGY